MLMFILTLLKIIGCILLALLLLVLVILLLVLFVPVRYHISGGKNQVVHANAQVSWLLHLIRGSAVFDQAQDDPLHIKLKVLFLTIYDNQRPSEGKAEKGEPVPVTEPHVVKEETQAQSISGDEDGKEAEPAGAQEAKKPDEPQLQPEPEEEEKKKKTISAGDVLGKVEGIGDKLESLQEKAEKLSRKKEKLLCLFDNTKNREWMDKALFRLKKLLIYLLPDIKKLYLHFGFDDPALTGKLLGGLSTLYPICEERLRLVPEFDKEVLEGEAAAGGAIRLYRFLVFALPTFLNPRFFKILKKVKCILK